MEGNRKDGLLSVTTALPNGAAAVTSSPIDLMNGANGDFLANCQVEISAPALATGVMGDAKTIKYDIVHGDDSALGDATVLLTSVLTQTGAGGAGCAAAIERARLPVDVKRYVGVKATGSATGNTSTSSYVAALVF